MSDSTKVVGCIGEFPIVETSNNTFVDINGQYIDTDGRLAYTALLDGSKTVIVSGNKKVRQLKRGVSFVYTNDKVIPKNTIDLISGLLGDKLAYVHNVNGKPVFSREGRKDDKLSGGRFIKGGIHGDCAIFMMASGDRMDLIHYGVNGVRTGHFSSGYGSVVISPCGHWVVVIADNNTILYHDLRAVKCQHEVLDITEVTTDGTSIIVGDKQSTMLSRGLEPTHTFENGFAVSYGMFTDSRGELLEADPTDIDPFENDPIYARLRKVLDKKDIEAQALKHRVEKMIEKLREIETESYESDMAASCATTRLNERKRILERAQDRDGKRQK